MKANQSKKQKDSVEDGNGNNKNTSADQQIVVAIGASAGGLSALERFFKNISPNEGLAYIVIQHLDPKHKSMLPDILQRFTSMEVQQAQDMMDVEPNKVYVIPPGYDMFLDRNQLILNKQENPRGVRLPIDYFFRSLKNSKHEKAVGIILSGTGSDGTLGLREIKAENGTIMVQSPETADHRGMPDNAIETGLVDFILPPEKMPEKLHEFIHQIFNKPSRKEYEQPQTEIHIKTIFEILKAQTKHDFTDYKLTTVIRRIERRVAVNNVSSLDDYIELLKEKPVEVDSLFNEFLIGVTSFFRDKEAFKSLESLILPEIAKKDQKETIRVWVTGCSTGEEAYSLAIIIHKFLNTNNLSFGVQIFASDIDEKALDSARYGRYPINIEADVPIEYLKTYFHKKDNHYQIKKEIRDMVVFANQSIIKDPPYSRIDLISCRNLLIYLKSEMQTRILDVFHYALNPDGYLFLGNSESLGAKKDFFNVVDGKWKIFQKIKNNQTLRSFWAFPGKSYSYYEQEKLKQVQQPKISLKEFAEKTVHSEYMYPFFIINKEGEIQYSLGKLKTYFELSVGEPDNNILSLAIDAIKVPLANALRKMRISKDRLVYDNIRIKLNEKTELIKLSVIPINKPASLSNLYIVTIQPSRTIKYMNREDEVVNDIENQDEYIKTIENELNETRDYLQNVIEELETSNEELKSANEEAQSSNEELQSTNEELETSKEELQSLNEELETSNHELQRKVSETTQINNDMNNFITSTQIGVIFLGKDMTIQRFTPSMRKIIDLLDSDIGRPIFNFVTRLNYDHLIDDSKEVLDTLVPKEGEVTVEGGGHYWMRILPYRTMDDKINGIVITFTDISELKKAEAESNKNKERFQMLFENMNSGILVVEIIYDDKGNAVDGKMLNVNKAYWKQIGIERKNIIGKTLNEIFPEYRRDLFKKLVHVAKTNEFFEAEEYIPQFEKHLKISAYQFGENKYIAIFDDITERIKTQKALADSEEKFRGLFRSFNIGVMIGKIIKNGKSFKMVVDKANDCFEKITGIENPETEEDIRNALMDKGIAIEDKIFSLKKNGEVVTREYFWKTQNKYLQMESFLITDNQFVLTIDDITNEKKELLASQHLASIVESSEDAIYSLSFDGTIISWNKGAEKFYGYSQSEIIGRNVSVLSVKDKENIHHELIEKAIGGQKVKNIELFQLHKSGKKIPVSLTKSPIKNEKGEVVAISDVVKDMTKIKIRETQLVTAMKKAEQAAKLKTSFLQNISHEIRTPMNSIIGFADVLKNRIKNQEDLVLMHVIEESGEQLIHLIDDILDVSRIEAGELSVTESQFNITELLWGIKEQFEAVKKNRKKDNLELRLTLPNPNKEEYIQTDTHRLKQIISNLLSNAVKYTEKGHIEFGYKRDKDFLLFFVKDTGKGIKKEYHTQIFERFQRVDIDAKNIFSGTGLGLAITKGLTEMLGGKIWCESEVGTGSNFFFTIPAVNMESFVKEEKKIPKEDHVKIPDLKGKAILIAEDDQFSFLVLKVMLEETNATILHAGDGVEAIDFIKTKKIDLALLDIRMPKMNGYEVLEFIKKSKKDFPVLAQTAYAMADDKGKMMNAGFEGYLTKPITSINLYRMIKKVLHLSN